MNEPDWSEYLIDPVFDSPGSKMRKLETFMHSFIRWRERVRLAETEQVSTNTTSKKSRRKVSTS